MGLIPTLLNLYARNERYKQQRKNWEESKRNDAQKQQEEMRRAYEDLSRSYQSGFSQGARSSSPFGSGFGN